MSKKLIVICSLLLMVVGIGCASFSRIVTPAHLDVQAVEYVVDANVAEPNEYAGYANLYKAEKLEQDVDVAHSVIQFNLYQEIEEDDFAHSLHKKATSFNVAIGRQREETLFGEKGLLSLGLSLAGFGTLTGFLGLMRKRPGDITSAEMEQTVAAATGKTTEELSAKEKQLVQVVKGVQEYIKTFENSDAQNTLGNSVFSLKNFLDKAQDTDTKVAVATIKKTL